MASALIDARTGKNGRHRPVGLMRQLVFRRLAGYEEVNDADRLRRDPTIPRVVGDGHGRYVTFQMAEVVVPRQMFQDIPSLIARLRAPPAPA
jgi:hypothetical protein